MATSDWLIGSYPNLEAQSVTVSAPGAEACPLAAGSYYLFDNGSAFDLLTAFAATINAHTALAGVQVFLTVTRQVRILGGATPFAITWPTDGILRDLLGFTGNLASATAHTAPNISPLFWSPGRTTTWDGRLGSDGIPVEDTAVGQSGPGTMTATRHNSRRRNTLIYRYLDNSRMWTTSEAGGEFIEFWKQVLTLRRRFKVWRNIAEATAGTGAAVFSTKVPSTGAYKYSGGPEMPWAREYGFKEALHPVSLPVVSTPEYT